MTLIGLPHAVKVEPTVSEFFLAKSVPTMATSEEDVGEKTVPATSFSVPPPAPPTPDVSAVPGVVVPVTVTGKTKVPDEPPPN